MSESVYLFDASAEEVVGVGVRNERGSIVLDEGSVSAGQEFVVVAKDEFYQHSVVQNVVPQGTHRTQAHVECMVCGFETVFGVNALIRDSRWENKRNGYPKRSASCSECGENAWREVERQSSPCDWSDSFEWADQPRTA